MRVPRPRIAVGGGPGGQALTGSETDERPEAMLFSRRIICILLPHRGAGRRNPTPTPNPSLALARLRRPRRPAPPPPLLRPRDAASPLPEAAIWGGAARGVRPWKLREASGSSSRGAGGEACGEKKIGIGRRRKGRGRGRERGGSLAAPLDFSVLFLAL